MRESDALSGVQATSKRFLEMLAHEADFGLDVVVCVGVLPFGACTPFVGVWRGVPAPFSVAVFGGVSNICGQRRRERVVTLPVSSLSATQSAQT